MSEAERSNHKCIDDIKGITIQLLGLFDGTDNGDLKWSVLKEYTTKYIKNENFDRNIIASYIAVISALLDSLSSDLFTEEWQESLFDEVFLYGVHHEAFLVLTKILGISEGYKEMKILSLLLKFLHGSALKSFLMYQCVSHKGWDLKYVSKSYVWSDLITAIISLPDKVANKTKGKCGKLFTPSCYVPLLLSSVFKVFTLIHDCLKNSQDCSLEFLAKLCGRLCITGNADLMAKKFVKEFISVSECDFIWRRIAQNFITKMPSSSLDYFIPHLLLVIPWYGYVEWFLGDDVADKNEKINYIMTVKLLFLCTYKQNIILQNIIGYFASSPSREFHFFKILNSLLDAWADERASRCQSNEQKAYIASSLMICAGWLRKLKSNVDNKKKEYISKVLEGTHLKLGSSEELVRSLGMIVGENLIKSIQPDSPPLEFEFADSGLSNNLKILLEIPTAPAKNTLVYEDLKCFEEFEAENILEGINLMSNQASQISATVNELDSDDELEPYDMPEIKDDKKRPLYIRDCMKGLVELEDAEYTGQCLKYAEELIKSNPYAAKEVAEEMAMILLHLDDKFAIPDFLEMRLKILIALTVDSPVVVSEYLISQLSARDYNIRQRLDILEVLAASSMLLSQPNNPVKTHQPHVSVEEFASERESSWQMIVKNRIEAKTKYFTKKKKSLQYENKFSAVAENFFYPLLNNYNRNDAYFNLKKENYVLGRFIYTLGIIMHSAANTVHCTQMARELLKFLDCVHSHFDPFVRESVLFAVTAAYISVNPSVLVSSILLEVMHTNEWLENIASNDPEESCVEKAEWAQSLFASSISQVDTNSSNIPLCCSLAASDSSV